jgi:exonuclease SbcC
VRFERLRLANFKCYESVDVRLDRGVTVIHGLNGSGKSSLLEACFFALYGTKALDSRLDEIVTIGTEQASVELWFTHGGRDYHIERRVRVRDENAKTTKCVLETPDGPIEGARDVRARIGDLLRMDAEAFVNCAYVRQGEVNKLINASPRQRQDMIDDLLQLGRLEDYRERASDARVGVGRVRDTKEGELTGLIDQIEEKEERDLHARLNDCQTEHAEITEEIEGFEAERKQAVTTRDECAAVLEEADEQREEIAALTDDIETLRTSIEETESERESKTTRLRDLREQTDTKREDLDEHLDRTDLSDDVEQAVVEKRITALEERDEELLEYLQDQQLNAQELNNRASQLEDEAEERERRASEARQEADELESSLEEKEETLTDRRAEIESLREKRSTHCSQFDDAPCNLGDASEYRRTVSEEATNLGERVAELRSELRTARDAVTEVEQLKAEGKCPECGQPVDGSPHVEAIEERREQVRELESELEEREDDKAAADERVENAEALVELESEIDRLESEIDTQEQLIENEASSLSKDRNQVGDLREKGDTLSADANEKREAAEQAHERAKECRAAIGEVNGERQDVKESLDTFETIESLLDDIETATTEIEHIRNRREELESLNEERRERLKEKRREKQDREEQFDEERIETAKSEKERAEQYIERADATLDELTERRNKLQGQIGAIRNEIEALEELRERRDELQATVEQLESLYEETKQLQTMYADLRAELRQHNVEKLERLLNDTFDLIYQNDSYARIELDGEYELTVYQKDGEELDPEQLSGGERALFNLSLRCAIYRLLAEGIEGSAPMPTLILDEPTVFLDSGHVSKLLDLVESMRDIGVEQIVVVSHDDELVGAADDLVRVAKDPTTNRSTVERQEALSLAD